jgi:hypothetical protein
MWCQGLRTILDAGYWMLDSALVDPDPGRDYVAPSGLSFFVAWILGLTPQAHFCRRFAARPPR